MRLKPKHESSTLLAPWRDEFYHADDSHPRLTKEKGAAGQQRLGLQYASALAASPLESAQLLAERLRACRPNDRCGSGACPPCTWATNRWFRASALGFASTATVMLFTTVQLPDPRAMLADLNDLDMDLQKELLLGALGRAGLDRRVFFGAADFSLNIWPAANARCWSAHWALFTPDGDAGTLTSEITSMLPRHSLVPVPVKTKVITRTPDKAFSYGFKNVFDRKVMPRDVNKTRKKDPKIVPGEKEFDDLAVSLDRIGIMARFFSQACVLTVGGIERSK